MIINLNQPCNVILTAHGAEVYNEYFRKLNAICHLIEPIHLKAGVELSLQLWELMNIFGKHLYNGAENCFANNDISFNDKIVKIPERSREEIKELLANWKGTLVVGNDISLSPWISVEERLPEIGTVILEAYTIVVELQGVRQEDESIIVSRYYGEFVGDGSIEHMMGGTTCSTTHHWMEIPKLPKEEKK